VREGRDVKGFVDCKLGIRKSMRLERMEKRLEFDVVQNLCCQWWSIERFWKEIVKGIIYG